MLGIVKKKLWLNVFLLAIVLLLIVLLVYTPKLLTDGVDKKQGLFKATLAEVNHIRIERQGQVAVVLAKQKNQWLLVKPALAPINNERVRQLLTIIDEPIQQQLARKKDDLKTFKLDAERIKLTLNDEEITFGMINPITKNRYVLKNRNIYTIKEIVYGTLGSSVTHLLQHRLLPTSMRVTKIKAPALFNSTKQALQGWHLLEATNIADYTANETILGFVSLTLQNDELNKSNISNRLSKSNKLITLVFDILAVKPTLILGRADLKVKYTIDKMAAKQVLAIEQ